MKTLKDRKLIIYLTLLMLLLSIAEVTYDTSYFHPYINSMGHRENSKTELLGNIETDIEFFTSDTSLSSDFSLTRPEQINRLPRKVNRVFNPFFAILFKVVIIPVLTLIISILMFCLLYTAVWWILKYIHKADGEKNKSILLPL